MAVVMALVVVRIGWANFTLNCDEHLDVISPHDVGHLNHRSTATIMVGGELRQLYVRDGAEVRVLSGGKVGPGVYAGLYVDDIGSATGSATILGGEVWTLYANDYSTVNVTGGEVWRLGAKAVSVISVSGGEVTNLHTHGSSNTDISGGIIGRLASDDRSVVDISGGSLNTLDCQEFSRVTFHGYDFFTTSPARLEDDQVVGYGRLSGKWFDGSSWTVNINRNDGRIRVIPEPSTLALLTFGALGLLAYGWRRRR